MCNVCVWKFEYPKRWAAIYPPCLGDFDPILQSRLLRERGFRSSKLLSGRTLESRKLYKFPYFRAPSNLGQLRTLRHPRTPPPKKKGQLARTLATETAISAAGFASFDLHPFTVSHALGCAPPFIHFNELSSVSAPRHSHIFFSYNLAPRTPTHTPTHPLACLTA